MKQEKQKINWTILICIFLGCMTLTAISILFSVSYITSKTTTGFTEAFAEVGKENPEWGVMALTDEYDDFGQMLTYLSLLKQMNTQASLGMEGDFRGRFTTKEIRELEKVDLECINEYNYFWINDRIFTDNDSDSFNRFAISDEEREDRGCILFSITANSFLWKCPKRNCELREISREEMDKFIPTTFSLREISGEAGVIKTKN